MRLGKLQPRSPKSSYNLYHSHSSSSLPVSALGCPSWSSACWDVTANFPIKSYSVPIIICIWRSQRCSCRKCLPAGRHRRVVYTTDSSIMPKHLGQERIASASKAPLCFPAQVNTGKWTMAMPSLLKSQHTVVRNAAPTLSFLPHVFSLNLNSELNTTHANSTAVEQVLANTASIPGIYWIGGEKLQEKTPTQTCCFPFVTPGIQKQVNKKFRWKSTQCLLIWQQVLSHLPSISCLHFATSLLQAVKDLWLSKLHNRTDCFLIFLRISTPLIQNAYNWALLKLLSMLSWHVNWISSFNSFEVLVRCRRQFVCSEPALTDAEHGLQMLPPPTDQWH